MTEVPKALLTPLSAACWNSKVHSEVKPSPPCRSSRIVLDATQGGLGYERKKPCTLVVLTLFCKVLRRRRK